jgi:hypothetical protein
VAAATIWVFPTHTLVFPYVDRLSAKFSLLRDVPLVGNPWYELAKAMFTLVMITLFFLLFVRLSSRNQGNPRNLIQHLPKPKKALPRPR